MHHICSNYELNYKNADQNDASDFKGIFQVFDLMIHSKKH